MSVEYTIGKVTVNQLHEFGVHAQDAMGFLASAIQLDQCRQGSIAEKYEALDANMKLWVGVQTLVNATGNQMTQSLKEKLSKLRDYVIKRTLAVGEDEPGDDLLNHFIHINLQISEGLLEGSAAAVED